MNNGWLNIEKKLARFYQIKELLNRSYPNNRHYPPQIDHQALNSIKPVMLSRTFTLPFISLHQPLHPSLEKKLEFGSDVQKFANLST